MKNIKIQTKTGTCGLYNLANVLRDENFLIYEDQDELIPFGHEELNKVMKYQSYPYKISPFISAVDPFLEIPKDYFISIMNSLLKHISNNKENALILLLIVQMGSFPETLHATSLICLDNKFAYTDPHFDEFKVLKNIDELFENFIFLNQIWAFVNKEGKYISFDSKFMGFNEIFN